MNKSLVKVAVKKAEESKHAFRVGAVLFSGSNIIAAACNDSAYVGFMRKLMAFPSRHAEVEVVRNIPRETLKGSEVLVVRITKKGLLAYSKPCKPCTKLLTSCGIRRVHYVAKDGSLAKMTL